jgi:hypothetical protein
LGNGDRPVAKAEWLLLSLREVIALKPFPTQLDVEFDASLCERTRKSRVRWGTGFSRFSRAIGAGVLAATMLGAGAGSALAFGTAVPCAARSEAPVFQAWGDSFNYFSAPNGGFEAGSTDWLLSGGAAVITGNEPFKVGGATHAKSLRIPAGGTAESRTICVSRGEDTIRLFVNNARVPGAILHVEAIVRSSTGQVAQTAFDVNGEATPAGWSPTMRLGIPNLLGGSGSQELTLSFTTRGTPATWIIDDVYVDPYKSY